jgi:hypothetical protein
MPRKKKNNASYFSHDADMRNDPKIKAVRAKFGNDGYAAWGYLLEVLTNADGFRIQITPINREVLSADFGLTIGVFDQIIAYFIKLELIKECPDGYIYSPNLCERLAPVVEKRLRAQHAAELAKERKEVLTLAFKEMRKPPTPSVVPQKFEEMHTGASSEFFKKDMTEIELFAAIQEIIDTDDGQKNTFDAEFLAKNIRTDEEKRACLQSVCRDYVAKETTDRRKTMVLATLRKYIAWYNPPKFKSAAIKNMVDAAGKPVQFKGEEPLKYKKRLQEYQNQNQNGLTRNT